MILYLTLAWLALRILGGLLLWRYRRQIYARYGCAHAPPYAPTGLALAPQSAAPLGLN